ncbi:MAG: bifunctional pyr operon transcriptional regulator/uracil phosphoribosyltransferase PyrR [Bacteroidia bacterium]|nr:bifunctional pyr operon transcriptional regulator/uracil phosphoribosyltransferase PyrR [Bacteroidia bacterium]MDW8159190.1 bifunctional pyr operon transcriptional regulator/uracil phosphoribosyltransferase PyrR [Bacteroidia bacterium]
MPSRELFLPQQLSYTLLRLAEQLKEKHENFASSCIIGIQPRGIYLARRIHRLLLDENITLPYGELDVTFHRDDYKIRSPLLPNATKIDFLITDKRVILVDDVLYTGRTVRAALDAILSFGRPALVELLVLVDRKRKRDLPIMANYVGIEIDSLDSERVTVEWQEIHGKDSVRIETRSF